MTTNNTDKIRELNDKLREHIFNPGDYGKTFITCGVQALSIPEQFALFKLIQEFNAFNPGNDTYGEHDFGRIEFQGVNYFFKIDYYDKTMTGHSPDASDNSVTNRILTVMRSDEY